MHTPGPWTVSPCWSQTCGDGYSIAEERGGDAEMAANARLIAAAPEMLEALRQLYDETKSYIEVNNLGDPHHNQSMQMSRDSLNKAEGRQ